jgi:hypothetical protein
LLHRRGAVPRIILPTPITEIGRLKEETMRTPTSPRRRIRAAAAVLAGAGVLLLSAGPALAANEFPPDPSTYVDVVCRGEGGFQATAGVELINSSMGQSPADFDVTISTQGALIHSYSATVVPGSSDLRFFELVDDQEYTVVVDSQPMIDQETHVISNDCADPPTGSLTYSCWQEGPVLYADMVSNDPAGYDVTLTDGIRAPLLKPAFVGTDWDAWIEPEDTTISASLSYANRNAPGSTTMAALDFTTDCTQPMGSIVVACSVTGPMATVTLARDDLQDLTYTLEHGNGTKADIVVTSGTGDLVASGAIPEDEPYSLTASFGSEVVAAYNGTPDCVQPGATVEVSCVDGQATIETTLAADDLETVTYDIEATDGSVTPVPVPPGASLVLDAVIPEDVAYSTTVRHDGALLASADGTADCQPPTPVTTTTAVPPTVDVPAPAPEVAVLTSTTSRGTLPVTGTSTLPMVLAGGSLIGLGIALSQVGRRSAMD